MSMQRKYAPAVFATALMALAMVSCGDDTVDEGASPTETLPSSTDSIGDGQDETPEGYVHPDGVDDVVFEYSEVGGFVPRSLAFQNPPVILVTGDGRVFTAGAQIAIFPGPMLPAIQVQTISELGIQRLLAAADEAGLFAEIDYAQDPRVADASTTEVTINVDGNTWGHQAYALGIGDGPGQADSEVADEREALSNFIAQLSDFTALVGTEELGPTEIFEPTEYLFEALVVDNPSDYSDGDSEPTIVAWPAGVTVRLADASSCVPVPASEVGEVFESADQLTLFSEEGVIYQVLAKQQLPGSTC